VSRPPSSPEPPATAVETSPSPPGILDPAGLSGLSAAEAAARLATDGPNELPSGRRRGALGLAREIVTEPMVLLLTACGSVYFLLGDPREALVLLGFVFVVVGISLYQSGKTERALEALRDLTSPRALVVRDGAPGRIPGAEVVRGDVLVIQEGDRVAADARLLSGVNVFVDESLLTGESGAVGKLPAESGRAERPGGDGLPLLYAGTLVVSGQGFARVVETGAGSEIGRIGGTLAAVASEPTSLQKETGRLVRIVAFVGAALALAVALLYGFTRGAWLDGLLSGLTLAMALLPDELPVVLVVFFALGAWRIARRNVLTRRVSAIEALGRATILCVDKTGTLTENRMMVRTLYGSGRFLEVGGSPHELPETHHEVVEYAILASQRDPFDPTERAIRELGEHTLFGTEHLHRDWELVREYPFSHALLAVSHVWKPRAGGGDVVAAKGAPEAIADLCHLGPRQIAALDEKVQAMAAEGLRVLAVARAAATHEATSPVTESSLPPKQHDFAFELVGLVGLEDPVRPGVPSAIAECRRAGIRVVMLTGDYAGTASHVARQIGLESHEAVVTGPEMDAMEDAELARRARSVCVFARIVPEQKLRLVRVLQGSGEIVAMTGDGVNDAPALRAADIGIAMGARGTDVAREAADLVLSDDDFSSIVRAIAIGRRIFDNLKKALAYILAVHVPIAGMSLLPVLFRWPLVLLPVHIVFLHLIIEPACSIVFEAEAEEKDVMTRPPRRSREPFFSRRTIGISLLQGAVALAIVLAVFLVTLHRGKGDEEARAMFFVTLIVANLGLILTNRSWSRTAAASLKTRNAALWWVVGGAIAFLGLVLAVPLLRRLFLFAPLHPDDLAICLAAGLSSVLWFEILKAARRPGDLKLGVDASCRSQSRRGR
jgi:Ca2+-transporting ATPase